MNNYTNYTNAATTSNGENVQLARAFAFACGVPLETVSVSQHFSVSQFLTTACLIVVALTAADSILSILKHNLHPPEIDKIFFQGKNSKVAPSSEQKKKKNNKSKANEKSKAQPKSKDKTKQKGEKGNIKKKHEGRQAIETVIEDEKDAAKTDIEDKKASLTEDAMSSGVESPYDEWNVDDMIMDVPENSRKAKQQEMAINILQAVLTIIAAISYWYIELPKSIYDKDIKTQIICRAAHFTALPLFKPVSFSMWPALMPLIQFVHWQNRRGKKIDNYQNRVLPGLKPFEINWLSLIYVTLVGFCWLVYSLSTLVFLPLLLVSCWIIVFLLYVNTFVLLHLPVQFLKGRLCFCRCCLRCWQTSDLNKLEPHEKNWLRDYFFRDKKEGKKLKMFVRNSNVDGNDAIEMLTLKALTVLFILTAIVAMYFIEIYDGKPILDVYKDVLGEFNFRFTLDIIINLDFRFIFKWPDKINLTFQFTMGCSIGLVLFQRVIALILVLDDYLKKIKVTRKSLFFKFAVVVVYAPYKFGEYFYIGFEIGLEIMMLCTFFVTKICLGCCIKEFNKKHAQYLGVKYGAFAAFGKTGLYTIQQSKIANIFPCACGKQQAQKDAKKSAKKFGSGLQSNTISMYLKNQEAKMELVDIDTPEDITHIMKEMIKLGNHDLHMEELHFQDCADITNIVKGLIPLFKANKSIKKLYLTNSEGEDNGRITEQMLKDLWVSLEKNESLELIVVDDPRENSKTTTIEIPVAGTPQSLRRRINEGPVEDEDEDEDDDESEDKKEEVLTIDHMLGFEKFEPNELSCENIGDLTDSDLIALGGFLCLETSTNLKKIIIDGNYFYDAGVIGFGKSLKKIKALKILDMQYTNMTNDGIKGIAEGLKENKTLTQLSLSAHKDVSDEGAIAVGKALEKNDSLTRLDLDATSIGDKGVKGLCQSLKKNNSLTYLELSETDFTLKGAKTLGSMLLNNNIALNELYLNKCKLGNNGLDYLSKGLKTNNTLVLLELEQIGITKKEELEDGIIALCEALKTNLKLTRLSLADNKITEKGLNAFLGLFTTENYHGLTYPEDEKRSKKKGGDDEDEEGGEGKEDEEGVEDEEDEENDDDDDRPANLTIHIPEGSEELELAAQSKKIIVEITTDYIDFGDDDGGNDY